VLFLSGSFLVARPTLHDPNFRQTVVLLLEHTKEGALGLIVNRPKSVKGLPFKLYAGGPCSSDGLLMLHGHREWLDDSAGSNGQGVAPGIFMGDSSCLERVGEALPAETPRFRVFSGYAGWGPGQLENELGGGDWTLVPASGELLFDTAVEDLWRSLIPPRIPQPSVN
jgi:putative transcriptional regulator